MYKVYFGAMPLPRTPEEITLEVKGRNDKIELLSIGEASLLKSPGLSEIEFEAVLPATREPFGNYLKNVFHKPSYFLGAFESLIAKKQPFQFIVTRKYGKTSLHKTNIKVTLEGYSVVDSAEEGGDTTVSFKLRQYREPLAKRVIVKKTATTTKKTTQKPRATSTTKKTTSKTTTYTVKRGDTLSGIAKKKLGKASRWREIYNLNKNIIKNPNVIKVGWKLKIPKK